MRHLQERKAKKEGKELPRRNPLDVSDFDPSQYALRIWREERKNHQELCAETRRTTTDIGMKPVDQPTRLACTAFVCKINITRRRLVRVYFKRGVQPKYGVQDEKCGVQDGKMWSPK